MKAKTISNKLDLESEGMKKIMEDIHYFLENQNEWDKYTKELGPEFIHTVLLLTMFERTQRCIGSDNFEELFSFVLSSLLAFTGGAKKAKENIYKSNRVLH